MSIGSLFASIGGLELGLVRAGLGPVRWQAEIDPWRRSLLRQHFSGVRLFSSVQEVNRGNAERVRLVCGGFPCPPVSFAGKRLGTDDPRWLWPEMLRVTVELEPEWVVIENVPGLRTLGLRGVLEDLAAIGFDAEWFDLRASDVGAPHRRSRLFIVAHCEGSRLDAFRVALEHSVADARRSSMLADAERRELQRRGRPGELGPPEDRPRLEGSRSGGDAGEHADRNCGEALADGDEDRCVLERETRVHADGASGDDAAGPGEGLGFPPRPLDDVGWRAWVAAGGPEPVLRGRAHGVPDRLHRLAALGDAVVPVVSYVIGQAIRTVW